MKPSDPKPSGPAKSPQDKESRDASGGQKGRRSDKAGSGNTLGDGRTAGGGYNADKRDDLTDNDAGEPHGDER